MRSTPDREMPAPEMIQEILARSRPDLERLFQHHWLSAEEAEDLLGEALSCLLMQWDRIDDPSLWLYSAVDTAIRRRLLIPLLQ